MSTDVATAIRNKHYAILYDSPFFQIAPRVEAIANQLQNFITAEVVDFGYKNPPELAYLGKTEGRGSLLVAKLNLPDFPAGIPAPTIYCLNTAENNAMTIGRLYPIASSREKLGFQLARFHLGPDAQEDMRIAMYQASQIENVRTLFTRLGKPEQQAYIVYITREGQLTNWQSALFQTTGLVIPANLVNVKHVKDQRPENPFGRAAMVYTINLKGLKTDSLKTLVICDNTASSMQQTAVLGEIVRHLNNKNGHQNTLKKILIVSPLLTAYGAGIISYFAATLGLEAIFVCSGAILGCNPPDRYYSPVIKHPNLNPDPGLVEINHLALGSKAKGLACARCDWTESFFNPKFALRQSDNELRERCSSSNKKVLAYSRKVTQDTLKEYGVDPTSLLPYSTLRKLSNSG